MPKRKAKGQRSDGSAAKRPASPRRQPASGRRSREDADTKAMNIDAEDMDESCAVGLVLEPITWMVSAAELKPALDALWSETGLLPDLNAIIADFADLEPPCWPICGWGLELGRSLAEVPRRFRVDVVPLENQYPRALDVARSVSTVVHLLQLTP
jgi:hypothetical protein